MNSPLSNRMLRRFWFPAVPDFGIGIGVGVTAYSEAEAIELARVAAAKLGWKLAGSNVRDVDIRDLDQKHVIPNMGLVTVRGVWFPNLGA